VTALSRLFATSVCALALLGATPPLQLDSQYVLQRYALALDAVPAPKDVVFTYTVSQAGPTNIEQRHTIYRSGTAIRDETLAVDGLALHRKRVRFSHREDRYAIARLAPRTVAYQMLFLRAVKDGHHVDYVYDATPLIRPSGAWIDRITIDGIKFLPRVLHFHTGTAKARGTGEVQYASFGKYWMPVLAVADATIAGKPARERIAWSDYRFPAELPPSTFQAPKPLPQATLPPI
jgi:hypothetical protein